MIAAELASRRWFRSKQRSISDIRVVDQASIGPGALVVLEVAFADGGSERYLAPAVDGREPMDGEGLWSSLADAIDREERIGLFAAHRAGGIEPGSLTERRLTVEQSNTSVVLGERLILKLYRLLEPGDNPDVEVGAFLADAGFVDTPTLAGWVAYESDGVTACAAMLQAFVPDAGDAWGAMIGTLESDPDRGIEIAGKLGDVTARMHGALGSQPDRPDFPARPATMEETAEWRMSAERQLDLALEVLGLSDRDRLARLAPRVRDRFGGAFGPTADGAWVTRIHGDYHLGQLLARPDGGFSVIDFEGEPARPLGERRRPASPLRDVASMLRSLDYAARTAERGSGLAADGWLATAREAFLGRYGRVDAALLAAFELEKACYEIRYEAGMRPDWLWLPLAAVERLVA
jgi:trehalose synthase-fused probable maltokinase